MKLKHGDLKCLEYLAHDYKVNRDLYTATAKSLQSCPTLCDPIPGIFQAGTLEWVAISFSNA